MVLVLLLASVGLGFALYQMVQPRDLSHLDGYLPENRDLLRRDFKRMMQNSLERSYPVTLTEREINTWLAAVVATKQGGLLAGEVSLDGAWVRLEEGRAEVILERTIHGRPFSVSMFLQVVETEDENGLHREVKMNGGPFHPFVPFPQMGGRFGSLPVPQGFLILVLPSFRKLAEACDEEMDLLYEEMVHIKIEKGRLILDPRQSVTTITSPP
jgi:hypothetical protein